MRRTALTFLFLGALAVSAREGVVETRDGKSFAGHIRFESNLVIVVNVDTLLYAQVQLANLFAATFKPTASNQKGIWSGGQFSGDLDDSRAWNPWGLNEGVPHPWQDKGIGRLLQPGTATFSAGLFRIHTSCDSVQLDRDAFHYVYKPVRGNTEIITRVIQVQPTDPSARAGLMIRESLAADAPNIMLAVTAGRGGIFQWRDRSGEETKGTVRRDLTVPCWIRLKRDGDTFSGYKSNDGKLWGLVDRVILTLSREGYVGLAAAGRSGRQLHRSAFDNVQEGLSLPRTAYAPQVELQSGSTVAGRIQFADDSTIRFFGRPWQTPLPLHPVANIRFQFVPTRFASRLKTGRTGLLLANGDFVDGEFKGIKDGQVTVASVVLGNLSYDINNDVIAVILKKQFVKPADYEVRTGDGSVWLGTGLELTNEQVVMRESALGVCRIPLHELTELRRSN